MGEAIAAIERLKGIDFEIRPIGSGYEFHRKAVGSSVTGGPLAEISSTVYQAFLDKISRETGIRSSGHSTHSQGSTFNLNGKDVLSISINSDINNVSIYSFKVPDGEKLSMNLADYMIENIPTLALAFAFDKKRKANSSN